MTTLLYGILLSTGRGNCTGAVGRRHRCVQARKRSSERRTGLRVAQDALRRRSPTPRSVNSIRSMLQFAELAERSRNGLDVPRTQIDVPGT